MTAGDLGKRLALPVAVVVLIVLPFLLWGTQIETAALGWAETASTASLASGVIALLALDVLLPVPSSVLSLFAGASLGAINGALAIWAGMTLGCGVGALVGRGVLGPVDRWLGHRPDDTPAPARQWLPLVVLRPVPVLAEASLLLAAARGMPLGRLMAVTALANLPVAAFYGYFGARLLGEVPIWVMLLILALLAGGIEFWQRANRASPAQPPKSDLSH
ncbi:MULTISPECIES: VTT domain-containing protein [unclassified Marinovum]